MKRRLLESLGVTTACRRCSSAPAWNEQAFAEGRGPDPFSLDTATCVTGLQD